jgi:sugar O-acyltransferase (sialic acid O-acetyltransferase NeuD family)
VEGLVDDDEARQRSAFAGLPVISRAALESRIDASAALCFGIGDNAVRAHLMAQLWPSIACPPVIHPSAVVATDVVLEDGTFIGARAVVNPSARIGWGTIINTGAIVEHDVQVGRCVHVSPAACLAGGVRVGDRTHIALGAIVLDDIVIGEDSIVGAGAVVRRNVPSGVVVVGVPARISRTSRR